MKSNANGARTKAVNTVVTILAGRFSGSLNKCCKTIYFVYLYCVEG